MLGIETNPYRTGFNIWAHELEWKSTKSFRRGYIFFGNPNERSTTEPIQEFYVYFCPLFGEMARSDLDDEVYYDLTDFSEQFKNEVCLYAAAIAKMTDASSDQKKLFQTQVEDHQKKVRDLFNKEFVEKIKVFYKGKSELLRNYQLPPEGGSKLALFSDVAAKILDAKFNSKFPDYPKFSELLTHITSENLEQRVKSALTKIVKYNAQNRDGQAILQGLGLAGGSSIDVQNSKYANAIKQALINKGAGKVLNREEVIYTHYQPLNQYYSVDYKLEYQLEFVVLAALVFTGDIEICWNGDVTLTSQNLESVLQFPVEKYYLFNSIKQPSGLPIKALKKLFISLGVGDLTGELQEASTFTKLATATKEMVDKVVRTIAVLQEGVQCNGNALIDAATRDDYIKKLGVLQTMLDTVSNLDTKGKLNGFKNTEEEITAAFGAYPICDKVEALKIKAQKFETLIRYLDQAKSYVVQSETPLFNEMDAAIAELPQKLQEDDKSQKQYEAKLNSLKDSYADYYLKEYQKNRLSYADGQKRDKLLNSPKKLVCDIIKDVTVLTKTDYENWLNTINSLKVAEDVTKQKIKENPYHDFSPRENYNKPTVTIRELEEKLDSIYEKWVNAMKATFKDPQVIIDEQIIALPAIEDWSTPFPDQNPDGPKRIRAKRKWIIKEGSVTNFGETQGNLWICPTEIAAKKYTYKVRAYKESGDEGFLMVFNYENDKDFDWFNVGGWGNAINNIEQSKDGGRINLTAGQGYKVEEGRWYDLRVEVDGDSMATYINDKLQLQSKHRDTSMRGVYHNVTIDEINNLMYIKVVNVGNTGTDGTINLSNGSVRIAEMIRLSSQDGQDENTKEYPFNIIPRSGKVHMENNGARLCFLVEPFSINIITAKLK